MPNIVQAIKKRILEVSQMAKKNAGILIEFLPILSFIIPFAILYYLDSRSFETTWKGRTYYLFFIWLVFLETILSWEELKTHKINKLKSKRTIGFAICLLLPTIFVLSGNFLGLNTAIVNLYNQVMGPGLEWFANYMPLSIEYLVFGAIFTIISATAYGRRSLIYFRLGAAVTYLINISRTAIRKTKSEKIKFLLKSIAADGKKHHKLLNKIMNIVVRGETIAERSLIDFSIPISLLFAIGAFYTIDNFFPNGKITLLQIPTLPTAYLAADVLKLMGYATGVSIGAYSIPNLTVLDLKNFHRVTYAIGWPCAGVDSFLIYTVTILLFLKKSDISWIQRAIYFILGAIVTYFINILRIATIFVIALENGGTPYYIPPEAARFHDYYGPLYSIIWIISYPLIIIGSRALWKAIRKPKTT